MASRRKFHCMGCGVDTGKIGEHYMLRDEIWNLIHDSNRGMLCIGCAEIRLGRTLTAADFNSSYVNRPRFASDRLRSRLTAASTFCYSGSCMK